MGLCCCVAPCDEQHLNPAPFARGNVLQLEAKIGPATFSKGIVVGGKTPHIEALATPKQNARNTAVIDEFGEQEVRGPSLILRDHPFIEGAGVSEIQNVIGGKWGRQNPAPENGRNLSGWHVAPVVDGDTRVKPNVLVPLLIGGGPEINRQVRPHVQFGELLIPSRQRAIDFDDLSLDRRGFVEGRSDILHGAGSLGRFGDGEAHFLGLIRASAPSLQQRPQEQEGASSAEYHGQPSGRYLVFGGIRSPYLGIQIGGIMACGVAFLALCALGCFRLFDYQDGQRLVRVNSWVYAIVGGIGGMTFYSWGIMGHPLRFWGLA